jgi:hypothetical protein
MSNLLQIPCQQRPPTRREDEVLRRAAARSAKVVIDPRDAILSRLRDDSAAMRFKNIAEFRAWVLGVEA